MQPLAHCRVCSPWGEAALGAPHTEDKVLRGAGTRPEALVPALGSGSTTEAKSGRLRLCGYRPLQENRRGRLLGRAAHSYVGLGRGGLGKGERREGNGAVAKEEGKETERAGEELRELVRKDSEKDGKKIGSGVEGEVLEPQDAPRPVRGAPGFPGQWEEDNGKAKEGNTFFRRETGNPGRAGALGGGPQSPSLSLIPPPYPPPPPQGTRSRSPTRQPTERPQNVARGDPWRAGEQSSDPRGEQSPAGGAARNAGRRKGLRTPRRGSRSRPRRFHGVMVSTLDSESSDPSSSLGGTCPFGPSRGHLLLSAPRPREEEHEPSRSRCPRAGEGNSGDHARRCRSRRRVLRAPSPLPDSGTNEPGSQSGAPRTSIATTARRPGQRRPSSGSPSGLGVKATGRGH
ncbi:serine/arginine repetitive matrix protein 3-like [Acinonyx jubatus]|uniref:Serine/arginine repetitive matrix protein 3-like n=1 Tax=Acinonyx jubatus TaxID=32536 RepID=A0ABM3NJ59_ACIJB|nr:serine/arginine repetitive matrix protein 3-like [Acinonyx jubatus]